jgi:glutamyl-tRNA synthetase
LREPGCGRFAPSPTADLHVGNLRTALLAAAAARSSGRDFLWRWEDLDPIACRPQFYESQLADVQALGVEIDSEPVRQSQRRSRHEQVLEELRAREMLYPCFCSRRDIAEAVTAPHGDAIDGAYPGTCAQLSTAQRAQRLESGRSPAWRVRARGERVGVFDASAGWVERVVDDFVVCRADGVPAYNLASVIDDADFGVTQVVRGDDLLTTTPRHVYVQRVLGLATPEYVHVPLVVGPDGQRLAKRHGAVTRWQLRERGWTDGELCRWLIGSCGSAARDFAEFARSFRWADVPAGVVVWSTSARP